MQTAEISTRLDMLAIAAYRHLLEHGRRDDDYLCRRFGIGPDRINEIYRVLTELCVAERAPGRPGAWRAVEPRLAMDRLVLPLEDEARRSAAAAERLRTQLQSLIPVHRTATGACDERHHVDVIDDPARLAATFAERLAACRTQVHVLHPDDYRPWPFRETAAALLAQALGRGVGLRGVLQHGALSHAPTRSMVERLGSAGGDFRTAAELPAHLFVLDDDVCFMSVPGRSGQGSPFAGVGTTVMILQPAIVALLTAVCRTAWSQGSPFPPSEKDHHQIAGHLRQSILRLLAGGAKDEAVARRLGLSVRTCRRHISEIMQSLGAASRFQAGVEAHSLGLVPAIESSDREPGDPLGWTGSADGAA
ncbi:MULTISPECIES: helix-turn-helix transcriptional regulator [unclassified Streptomyces]|uniref:helix-turn-helix transcriptional regulator n=1 Tax=unclassified Streptomyces TaxID=2593676 RepID=UPI003332448C